MLIHIISRASALIGTKILRVAENRPVHGDAAVECYDTSAFPCHETAVSDVYVVVWLLAYIAPRGKVFVIRHAGRYSSVGILTVYKVISVCVGWVLSNWVGGGDGWVGGGRGNGLGWGCGALR
jgi:hypothetical protein